MLWFSKTAMAHGTHNRAFRDRPGPERLLFPIISKKCKQINKCRANTVPEQCSEDWSSTAELYLFVLRLQHLSPSKISHKLKILKSNNMKTNAVYYRAFTKSLHVSYTMNSRDLMKIISFKRGLGESWCVCAASNPSCLQCTRALIIFSNILWLPCKHQSQLLNPSYLLKKWLGLFGIWNWGHYYSTLEMERELVNIAQRGFNIYYHKP